MKSLTNLQKQVYDEYIKNGYLPMWTKETEQEQLIADLGEVGLIVTEIAEAMEDLRNGCHKMYYDYKGTPKGLPIELADIIIRTLNFATRKGIHLEQYIVIKNTENLKRDPLHGKKV